TFIASTLQNLRSRIASIFSMTKGDAMIARRLLILSAAVWTFSNTQGRAHFVFINIRPPAEAGRVAEIYFNDSATPGDAKLIDKIVHTRLWVQDGHGKFRELKVHKAADRFRVFVPATGSVAIAGECEYGVFS